MDLEDGDTAPNLSQFMRAGGRDDSLDGEDENDMELTEALTNKIVRKRSLSAGAQTVRRPLSDVPTAPAVAHVSESSFTSSADESGSQENTQSSMSVVSSAGSNTDADNSIPIEYTIPTGRATAPATDNAVWLALRSVTHSGDEPYEETPGSDQDVPYHEREGMDSELAEAQARLNAVRMSLGLDDDDDDEEDQIQGSLEELEETSFTSSEEGSANGNDDRTVNLTGLLSRPRPSMVSEGSAPMEETRVYESGRDAEAADDELQTPKNLPSPNEEAKYTVLRSKPKSPLEERPASSTAPGPFDFTFAPNPTSVSTPKVTPGFSKPPSPTKSKSLRPTSPSKAHTPSSIPRPTAAFALPVSQASPKKRPATSEDDGGCEGAKPSPAKKLAIADRWNSAPVAKPLTVAGNTNMVKRLSPSKRAPFLAPQQEQEKSLKNHLAKRKSIAVNPSATLTTTNKLSPKKDKGRGRASFGSAPSQAWSGLERDKECEKEKARQAIALPSETRGSPNPVSPRMSRVKDVHAEERVKEKVRKIHQPPGIVEEEQEKENMGMDLIAGQRWREGVQDSSFDEEELVCYIISFAFVWC
jgi:hypothetical protein